LRVAIEEATNDPPPDALTLQAAGFELQVVIRMSREEASEFLAALGHSHWRVGREGVTVPNGPQENLQDDLLYLLNTGGATTRKGRQ
jgi:hypothetical protein